MLKSKKGSYLVEAVLLMPLIVIIVVIMMCVSMHMYMDTLTAADMDREVRGRAGEESETVYFERKNDIYDEDMNDLSEDHVIDVLNHKGIDVFKAEKKSHYISKVKWISDREKTYSVKCSEISECRELWTEKF